MDSMAFGIISILISDIEFELPLKCWLPFELTTFRYKIVCIWIFFILWTGPVTYMSLQCIFWNILVNLYTQFDILKCRIDSINRTILKVPRNGETLQSAAVDNLLNELINHHTTIIKSVQT